MVLYTGIRYMTLNNKELADFYENRKNNQSLVNFYKNKISSFDLRINEYLLVKDKNNKILGKYKYDGKKVKKIKYYKIKNFKPKTVKQECCFDLMSSKNIPAKIIAGVPGSGKSIIALKYGFYFLDREWVNKIFIVRHNVSVGNRNGYFKGDKSEKVIQWLGCIKDNIDDRQETLEELVEKKVIEVEAVETIKGRDIKNAWIIIDECEDLTEEQFGVIGERVSSGSYICFTGDYNQTGQNKYKNNNGLKRAFQTLKGNPLVGFINFDDVLHDDVRSEISKIFAYDYKKEL